MPRSSSDPPPRGERFPVLASYAYLRRLDEKRMRSFLGCPWVDIMLDSGAFTAATSGKEIDLGEYCGFLRANEASLWQYVMLDVIGDPVATRRNLAEMLARGLRPMPVHVLGDTRERMDELFAVAGRVCLGGLKRPGRGPCGPAYLDAKMAWAGGRPVHWLGYVRAEAVQKHRPYSCDSSTWTHGMVYGKMDVYLGGGQMLNLSNSEASRACQNPAVVSHLNRLGFSAMDFMNPALWRRHRFGAESRCLPMIVNADSHVRYSSDLRARFGTRLALVTALSRDEWAALLPRIAEAQGGSLSPSEAAEAAAVSV